MTEDVKASVSGVIKRIINTENIEPGDLRELDRIAQSGEAPDPEFLMQTEDALAALLSGPDSEKKRFIAWITAAERILFALKACGNAAAVRRWQEMIERSLTVIFPLLSKPVTIAFYGTGRVAECLVSVLDQFAGNTEAAFIFLHSEEITGWYFRGYPIFNKKDLDRTDPERIVIATTRFREEICSELIAAGIKEDRIDTLPDEIMSLVNSDRELTGQIKEPPAVKDTSEKPWNEREPFFLHALKWQTVCLLYSFPELREKIRGIIDPDPFIGNAFGIPLLPELPSTEEAPVILTAEEALAEYLGGWEKAVFHPHRVRLEASTLCQLDCAGCYMRLEDGGKMGQGYVRALQVEKLLDENPWIREIELSNSGEPFCNPEMLQILELLHGRGIRIQFWNGTNLNDLPDPLPETIVRCGVETINVSLDGVSQEVYETYRRRGSIEKVFQNIKAINSWKRKYHSDRPHLKWQFILMNHNQHEAEAAARMAKELGMEISFKLDWRGGFVPEEPEKLSALTGSREKEYYRYAAAEHHLFSSDDICSQMILSPQINWDGRLLGCCNVYKSDWGINVFETPLCGIFNDPDYRAAVLSLLDGRDGMDHRGPCRNCFAYGENVVNYRHKLTVVPVEKAE